MLTTRKEALLRKVSGAAGALCLALGLVVIAGWHVHSATLVQVRPGLAPMQYNVALAFVFCGAGLMAVASHRERLGAIAGLVVALLAGATLGEYLLGTSFGIDTIFAQPFVFTPVPFPGRMGPNNAIAFLLAGLALMMSYFLGRQSSLGYLVRTFGALILALGSLVITAYIFSIQSNP